MGQASKEFRKGIEQGADDEGDAKGKPDAKEKPDAKGKPDA
jgi:hypothetical protein